MSGGMEAAKARERGAEHYAGDLQPCDVAHEWDLPYGLCIAMKYLRRYREGGHAIDDLKKAVHGIELEIGRLEAGAGNGDAQPV